MRVTTPHHHYRGPYGNKYTPAHAPYGAPYSYASNYPCCYQPDTAIYYSNYGTRFGYGYDGRGCYGRSFSCSS